jgi:hypothetical protein
MPMTPAQTRARAQKAARKRWHGTAADTAEPAAVLERAAIDKHVAALVASWHQATPEQKARLRRLFNPPAPVGGASG